MERIKKLYLKNIYHFYRPEYSRWFDYLFWGMLLAMILAFASAYISSQNTGLLQSLTELASFVMFIVTCSLFGAAFAIRQCDEHENKLNQKENKS